jgi:uncharacterized protein
MLSPILRNRFVAGVCVAMAGVAIGLHAAGPDTRLAEAAKQGDLKAVQTLLSEKVDVNATAPDGTSALHWAAFGDDATIVNVLIKAGANLRAGTRVGGITPLLLAAGNGNAHAVEALLSAGDDANSVTPEGTTVLMAAAASGSVDAVKSLLDHGAAPSAKDPQRGQTALMFAAGENRADVIKLLIAHNADVKATTSVVTLERPKVDEDGNPIADAKQAEGGGGARGRGNGKGVQAKEAKESKDGKDGKETAAEGRGGGRGGGGGGQGGSARGASATAMGGMTALLVAARDGHIEATRALVEGGANVNQASGSENASPLVIAIANGHYELAKYLLDHGADPNLATIDGLAALYATVDAEWAQLGWAPNPITVQEKVSYLDLMKALLQHGAKPNAQLAKTLWFRPTSHNQEWVDKKGATPFWRAAASSDVQAMHILVAAGADPNAASAEGVTPLMVAAGLGWGANSSRNAPDSWMAAVKYCLELGADVNAKDTYNYTALHGAAYRGDNEMVQFLVDKGAKLDVRSKKGQTVTDMANGPMVNAHLPTEHLDTIALLEKLGAPPPEVPVAGAPKENKRAAAAPAPDAAAAK